MVQAVVRNLPIEKLARRSQVRKLFDASRTSELAGSIKANGVLVPLIAHTIGGETVLVDGERRLLAAIEAGGLTHLPVMVFDRELSAADVLQLSLTLNLARTDLTPLEEARGLKALIDGTGCSASEAAGRVGRSAAGVSKALRLLTLPESILGLIESGAIPASVGYELSRIEDAALQAKLAEEVAGGRLTRDVLLARLKGGKAVSRRKAKGKRGKASAALGDGISVVVANGSVTVDALIGAIGRLLAAARSAPRESTVGAFLKSLPGKGGASC